LTASPFAIWPPRDSPVSVATWLHEIGVLSQVTMSPPPFPTDAARGKGQSVIVVPGFCSPEVSTGRLREFLSRQGFDTHSWDCGPNIGPTASIVADFERKLKDTAERSGKAVSLVGISLGGTIAREMAKRHPDRVACVVTLVSPIKLPVATPLAPLARFAALVWAEDARGSFASIAQPPPCPVTAIVNPKDGILDWRACMPEPAEHVEVVMVTGAHMTMASNPEAQRVVAARLSAIA
jgi:pimeloyl-ACP methyl ester carboxylesterase